MNNNIEKNLGNLSQIQILEKDPSLKMLELSKNYLVSIEKKFGVFLHKMGIDVGNYDGNLNGSKTGAEKIFNEKILPLKHKIEKEKHTLKKQDLLVQLTQAILMARGIDMGNIQKLATENGKDKEFQKESTDLLGNNEYSKFKNEIELEAQKFDDVYITKESIQDKEKIKKDLIESNKNAVLNYKDGKISKETYEKIISNNMNDARKNGIELEVTKDFGKYLELGMQSGTLPVVMMMTPVIKKGMPLLPAVIGVGIYARLVNTIQSDKISAGDKVLESGKVVGHTALSIAPITGSIMAINDASNSWDKVKNGTGTKAEAIADTIGAGVSIIFDGVTIVMAATGVGAIPAIGVAASRKAGVEGTKFGLKKLISKSGDIFNFGKNALIDFKNSSKALAGFKSIINESGKIVSTGFSKETMKDTWKYIGVDSIKGIKDLFTFKVTRDELNRSMFKLPGIGDMYKKLRPTKYRELNRLNITTKLSSGEESLNKDLEYIDSKKNDLSNGVTKELIEMINTKLAELAKKKSESQKNGNTSEIKTLEEIELKRLNKIFDILDYRAKKIDELGDKKLKEQNDKEWAGLHKYLKSYIENPNISHDIKNEIIKGLWTDTIKNQEYGYLKDGTIQKHINDFLSDKSKNFEEKANFLILLADKKLTKQEVNGKNITDYTKELLNNLSGHELINNAYVLNRLFNTIPELKTDKTLINIIALEKIPKDFKNYGECTSDEIGKHVLIIKFLSENGVLAKIINTPNLKIKESLETYITSITKENHNIRGTLNLARYFKGTKLEGLINDRINNIFGLNLRELNTNDLSTIIKGLEVEKISEEKLLELSKNIRIRKKFNNNEEKLNYIKEHFEILSIYGKIDINGVNNLLSSSKEQLNFFHVELLTFFEKHLEYLKGNKDLINTLKAKIQNPEINNETKNLLGKILGKISNYQVELPKNGVLETHDIILFINSKNISSQELIKLTKYLDSNQTINTYDKLLALDFLSKKFNELKTSGNKNDRAFIGEFKKLAKNQGTELEILEQITKTDFGKHLVGLTKNLGLELKVDYINGKGLYLLNKDNHNETTFDLSNMSNIKSELIDLIVSNSPLTNSKYHENIGRINYISVKTKFHEKAQSSPNETFNIILDFNREIISGKLEKFDLEKLLGEYHISNFGERFTKKVILSNHLIDTGKSEIVIKELSKDITSTDIPAEVKLSLIHNIQNTEVRDKLFEELLFKGGLKSYEFQHDLFKKLAFKIDNSILNKKIVGEINAIKGEILIGNPESLKRLDILISIIQESKNIDVYDEKILIKLFKDIKEAQNNPLATQKDKTHYDYLILELARINKINDHPEVINTISISIEGKTKKDQHFQKFLSRGANILNIYHNIDNLRFGEASLYSLKKLKEIINQKILNLSIKASDLVEKESNGDIIFGNKNSAEIILGSEISESFKKIGITASKISENKLYVKVNGSNREITFDESIKYKEMIIKLGGLTKKLLAVKSSDEFDNIFKPTNEEKVLMEKAGFDIEGLKKFVLSKDSDKLDRIQDFAKVNDDLYTIAKGMNINNGNITKIGMMIRGSEKNKEEKEDFKKEIENNSNLIKINPEIGGTFHNIDDYKLPIPTDLLTKIKETYGNKIQAKTLFGILITFKLMTPTEAQAAAQDIEQSWKNSPEYKEFNRLGGEKSQEALKIREEAVKKLAGEKLKPFIDGFDERIKERNKEKISSYPATIQVILSEAYDKGFPLIKDKSQRNINIFNGGLITYIDQVYNGTGKAEQAAQNLLKRFPEFEGTPFQKTILEIGKNIDTAALNITETEGRKKIIEKLKKL